MLGLVLTLLLPLDGALADGRLSVDCTTTASRFEAFRMPMPVLSRTAEILVYLPPGYDCATLHRYPVFYLNDGQDLFEWSWPRSTLDPEAVAMIASGRLGYGTWRLETQLDSAVAEDRLPPMIIVGIGSGNGPRSRDLVPVPWSGSVEGRGVDFGQFISGSLIPEIDRRYRTRANRFCRGIGGASLGGVSALHIGLAHAHQFGLVLSMSPVLGDQAIADHVAGLWRTSGEGARSTILVDFDMGAVGDADLIWLTDLLSDMSGGHRTIVERALGSTHTIDSWAERVIPAMEILIGNRCEG
ncbi:MAG: alpha/beta hydrolase-fold protein [Pseudomonadota bacterium]